MHDIKYKEIEEQLFNYKTIRASINHNQLKLENIELEDQYEDPQDKKKELKRMIALDTNKIRMIDNAINSLTELEKSIIVMFYIDRTQWWIIAQQINFSMGWCKAKRKEIIDKMLSYW